MDGRQLHQVAREGGLGEVEIPNRGVTVKEVWDVEMRAISLREIARQITDTISRVSGDFRQSEIISSWDQLFANTSQENFQLVSFKISVSGGTYIRGIVHSLGEKLGCGACIVSLHRTEVGDFKLSEIKNSSL